MKRIYNIVGFSLILIYTKQHYIIDLSNMSSNSLYNDIMEYTANEN
jgi:hypothetical protein